MASDYMSLLQSPDTRGQNMRQESCMNTVLFINTNIGFSENLYLVNMIGSYT